MAIELLAPAGHWTAMRAAVENGADAVYFGIDDFNARARAENFHRSELPQIMTYLHTRGVKGYLTLNVLIFADEVREVADLLLAASAAGVDAVLLQDLGIAKLANTLTPDLPIHASTQMTITDPAVMSMLAQWGVERFVVPREFAISDIARLHQATSLELETFVHGALCVAWSGQCLTSESFGGRSANRGECAQACRQPYELWIDGQQYNLGNRRYLLSPQDLAGIELIPQMIQAGVVCFKIEGRLKSAEYVANITRHYRRAIDQALSRGKVTLHQTAWQELAQSFSRGLSSGFLNGINHQYLVAGQFPKSRGLAAGKVVRVHPPYIYVEDCHVPLSPGDGIVFDNGDPSRNEPGGPVYDVTPQGQQLRLGLANHFRFADVKVGDLMWKTSDQALNQQLRASFAADKRTVPLDLQLWGDLGQPLSAVAQCQGKQVNVASDELLTRTTRQGLAEQLLRQKLGRLGGSRYHLNKLDCALPDGLALPVSALNRLRRAIVTAMDQALAAPAPRRTQPNALDNLRAQPLPSQALDTTELAAFCRSEAQLRAAVAAGVTRLYADFEDPRGFRNGVEIAKQANIPIYLATPRIIKPGEEGFLRKLAGYKPDGVLIRNLGSLLFFRDRHPQFDLIGDFSLNCANDLTARQLLQMGLRVLTPSYDLNAEQLDGLLTRIPADRFELVLHQYMPMFHMEHCVFAAFLSQGKDYRDCGRPCERHNVELKDHTGALLPVKADIGCRNTVFNGKAQSGALYLEQFIQRGVKRYRIEFLTDSAERVGELIYTYRALLSGQKTARDTWASLRASERLGVTKGTLDHSR